MKVAEIIAFLWTFCEYCIKHVKQDVDVLLYKRALMILVGLTGNSCQIFFMYTETDFLEKEFNIYLIFLT